ncbi:MAG: DinB family protein [Chitinophagaceae bacterium]
MRKFLFLLLLLPVAGFVQAQNTLGETLKAQLLKDWQRAKAYTQEYLDAMPADKYSFKAQDSIRSFAQQMLHLAQANTNLITNATGQQRPWNRRLEMATSAQSKDSVVYFVNASYDFVLEGIKNFDVSKLEEKVKAGNLEETRLAWLLKTFEHQTHHRGQTTIYIRLVGIKPPNEKLF